MGKVYVQRKRYSSCMHFVWVMNKLRHSSRHSCLGSTWLKLGTEITRLTAEISRIKIIKQNFDSHSQTKADIQGE